VFEDLGFPRILAAELKVKADLGLRIHRRIKDMELTQVRAAELLGLSQPDVSKLMNGRFAGYSVDRLLSLLNALDVDIDIVVRPKVRSRPRGREREGREHVGKGVVRIMDVARAG
jgi:predicted XRE-type DNA-binding protein